MLNCIHLELKRCHLMKYKNDYEYEQMNFVNEMMSHLSFKLTVSVCADDFSNLNYEYN